MENSLAKTPEKSTHKGEKRQQERWKERNKIKECSLLGEQTMHRSKQKKKKSEMRMAIRHR